MIYLDNAAATPLDPTVLQASADYFADKFYNPSALYSSAKSVRSDVESARTSVAAALAARANEIIFTSGGTEANNLAIHGIMQQNPQANMVVSAVEHDSVLVPAEQYPSHKAPVNDEGLVDLAKLAELIDDKTVLVSIMQANNEVGTIQPLTKVVSMIKSVRKQRQAAGNKLPIYLHTDACQATNYLNISNLGVDLMTLNGGKIYGPKQSGVLLCRRGVVLRSQILGGGQERGLRSGTENVAGITGFAAALNLAVKLRATEAKRLSDLQSYTQKLILNKLPNVILNGSSKHRLPNNLHFTFPGIDNERLMMQLDERGIICAVGSACSAASQEPSHVLKAMGLSDEAARSSLRFTMGRQTNRSDCEKLALALAKFCK